MARVCHCCLGRDQTRSDRHYAPAVTEASPDLVHRALGLSDDEAGEIERILRRAPNHLELAMFAVMWSEHCSYKSSRRHLARLPTEAPWVLVGPGENAGVIDVGDGIAVAIRIESHNHPSAIEPYQGAATGVGGIVRDIFTMGARPVALMDALRFGPLDDARSRWVAEGVVSGIAGYGNAVGVPTVGGEIVFDATYRGNPLVNVLCLGLLPVERLVLGRATGEGNLAVLLGSATGRDGIGGVSVLASAGFGGEGGDGSDAVDGAADDAKRPSVQVGDPFEEKRLIEACLALLDAGLVVGIQDLGGAGLTCATSETASRAGMGMDVDVAVVPRREPGMAPFEVMTSESQERMLAILAPGDLDAVLERCRRWEVRATVIGRVTGGGRLRILDGDGAPGDSAPVLADVPAAALHDAAPSYDRPRRRPDRSRESDPVASTAPSAADVGAFVRSRLCDPAWVYRQYDHQLFLNTVAGPGANATVLRLKHPASGVDTGRGLALTCDGNHRWCAVDPRVGTERLVAEAVLNLACVGAEPRALVNNLNFGNPEHPEVMWQLSEAIDGMALACVAHGVPVVGGNVSLYNESAGIDIDPTPVLGLLGVVPELLCPPPPPALVAGAHVLALGSAPLPEDLAGSAWAWHIGARGGALGPVDHPDVAVLAGLVRALVAESLLVGVADVADGGLAGTLAEMAAAAGVGLASPVTELDAVVLLAEAAEQVVAVVAEADVEAVRDRADGAGVTSVDVGVAGGGRLVLGDLVDLDVAELRTAWHDRLPTAFGA